MKLLTFYSDSHEQMYERYFLESFNKQLSHYKLHAKRIDQISQTGEYESQGFDLTMLQKIEMIISSIDIHEQPFVYADCDVQFFGDIAYDLGDYDILFQQDYFSDNYCAGFFIAKQSEKVLKFFFDVRSAFVMQMNGTIHDQTIINQMLRSGYPIKVGMLPIDKYWTAAFATGGSIWSGQDINVPKGIVMHHANFTVGVQNKIDLLEKVKSKLNIAI